MSNNRRGQIGETLTWVVATIVILVIILLFVFIASGLGGMKGLIREGSTVFDGITPHPVDVQLKKSLYTTHLVSEEQKIFINNYLKKLELEEKLNLNFFETNELINNRMGLK